MTILIQEQNVVNIGQDSAKEDMGPLLLNSAMYVSQ